MAGPFGVAGVVSEVGARTRAVNSKAQQSAATRAALIAEARRQFTEKGFAATTAEDVLQPLGLTRGALYHQFVSMRDLLGAVVLELMRECEEHCYRLADETTGGPLEQLRAGAIAYMHHAANPEFARIVLTDGPAVLGWQEMERMDLETWYPRFQQTVAEAIAAGASLPPDPEAAAKALDGALQRLSEWVAGAGEGERPDVLRRAVATVEALIR